jgi:hypothetical protein
MPPVVELQQMFGLLAVAGLVALFVILEHRSPETKKPSPDWAVASHRSKAFRLGHSRQVSYESTDELLPQIAYSRVAYPRVAHSEAFETEPDDQSGTKEPSPNILASLPPIASRKLSPEIGTFIENVPRRMKVGKQYRVEARIGEPGALGLMSDFTGASPPQTHEVTIVETMAVRLSSPTSAFKIEPQSDTEQLIKKAVLSFSGLVPGTHYGSWIWHATPLKSGRQVLTFKLAARVLDSDQMPVRQALPDQLVNVNVNVDLVGSSFRVAKWTALASGSVLIGAIVSAAVQDAALWPALKEFGSRLVERVLG